MTLSNDEIYLNLVDDVLTNGVRKGNRTGVETFSTFGHQLRFDLSDGTIPLLTTKKMHTKSIIHEILWYLQGGDNVSYLNDNGVHIWNEWADENGDLGPVYGYQWRKWPVVRGVRTSMENGVKTNTPVVKYIDQVAQVLDTLKRNPDDRRMIVSAWNVGWIDAMALPPCHMVFQFYVANNRLSCQLYQRSCDVGLGVPFNIAQYSILLRMIALVSGYAPGEFIWTGGDVHIYTNHVDALTEQLKRKPYNSPKLEFKSNVTDIDSFKYDDFQIVGYESHPTLKMEVAV